MPEPGHGVAGPRLDKTGTVRRHPPPGPGPVTAAGYRHRAISPAPPQAPLTPPGPFGDLSAAPPERIAALAGDACPPVSAWVAGERRHGTLLLLGHLAVSQGETWQEQWEAAGLNDAARPVSGLGDSERSRTLLARGVRGLLHLRVVRPSLAAFRANHLTGYAAAFAQMQRDRLLDEFFGFVDATSEAYQDKRAAKFDVTAAVTVLGITLAGLTPEALLHYGEQSRRLEASPGAGRGHGDYSGRQAWHFLHLMGHFSPATPATMRAAIRHGQRSVPEMIARHQIRDPGVRDLITAYVARRAVDLDYATVEPLARVLAGLFWARIEEISPGQADLRLSEATYQQWKAEISVLPGGRPRQNLDEILITVRSFYLDLQSWAVTEPGRWAQWAAPSPVRGSDVRGHQARRRRLSERMAQRTRDRQPLLPALAAHADQQHRDAESLLTLAAATTPGEQFTAAGRTYHRTSSDWDRDRARTGQIVPVRVTDQAGGRTINLTTAEDHAFWSWAIVETLRHSGLRAEELCELTHLSIRQYRRSNGEVAAMLVIAPSKTDRERVIPMSAELFAVIAAIIRRHQRHQAAVPLVRRYDPHERTWSDPLPYLFQRKAGTTRAVLSFQTIRRMLQHLGQTLAATRPEFASLKFATHDFRRIFATELVNNGLPIHIGAALLGHLSVQTTRGYVAVFDDDLVRHYQSFLSRRRALRPPAEYRQPTDAEWTEFEDHFGKRKVELGTCGRPYGTPCQHEHACIRCPVLHIDPRMLPRLDEIETDLLTRRDKAAAEGWHGELEGLDLTLSFLRDKRTHVQRFTRRTQLGIPAVRATHG